MTRFETEDGTQLGVRFFGGRELGTQRFLSPSEQHSFWTLDSDTTVFGSDGSRMSMEDFRDLMLSLPQCSEEEMTRRGWGDRLESGLHLQLEVTEDGLLQWTL